MKYITIISNQNFVTDIKQISIHGFFPGGTMLIKLEHEVATK